MALWCNLEWVRVQAIHDHAEAVRLGTDRATMPPDWIDLLTDDPVERVQWRQRELGRGRA